MDEPRRELTAEQLAAVQTAVGIAAKIMGSVFGAFAGLAPLFAEAVRQYEEKQALAALPREPLTLASLRRAATDGASIATGVRFDQEGKFRIEPSAN